MSQKKPAADVKFILDELAIRIEDLLRPEKKGPRTFVNAYEMLGKLTEEYNEVVKAIHDKTGGITVDEYHTSISGELFDVAIIAIWGILSINNAPPSKVEKVR